VEAEKLIVTAIEPFRHGESTPKSGTDADRRPWGAVCGRARNSLQPFVKIGLARQEPGFGKPSPTALGESPGANASRQSAVITQPRLTMAVFIFALARQTSPSRPCTSSKRRPPTRAFSRLRLAIQKITAISSGDGASCSVMVIPI
jgi:hypothetical protein